MTVIVAFVLLGKVLESKANFQQKRLLKNGALTARKGRKSFSQGHFDFVSVKELVLGDPLWPFPERKSFLMALSPMVKGIVMNR